MGGWCLPKPLGRGDDDGAFFHLPRRCGQGQVFFGEDIGECDTGNFTNATSTRDKFFSFLDPEIFTETFEGVTGNTPQNFAFGGNLNATLTQGRIVVGAAGGRCPISGTTYWRTKAGMTLCFTVPVAAFGFFGADFGDAGGLMNITTISNNGTPVTVRKDYTMGHTIGGVSGGKKVSCHNLYHTMLFQSNTHFWYFFFISLFCIRGCVVLGGH